MKRLLEARESRMLETSREMIQLTETNQELQRSVTTVFEWAVDWVYLRQRTINIFV